MIIVISVISFLFLMIILFGLVSLYICIYSENEKFESNQYNPIDIIEYNSELDFIPEERIKYYLGNVRKPREYSIFKLKNNNWYMIDNQFSYQNNQNTNDNYLNEMSIYYNNFKRKHPEYNHKRFIFIPGDVSNPIKEIPTLTKTRPIKNKGLNVILPLNINRHWKPISEVQKHDIPYEYKKDSILWRGVATGFDKRIPLVENYYDYTDEIDVGFTGFLDYYKGEKNPKFIKNKMSIKDMLNYKFLISVEGNDVASNLKWIMASNSLCIKPESDIESWLMEGKLKPWVHYVPVSRDFSDLLDIYYWCITNPEKCKMIIKNAQEYIKNFMNDESYIINRVLEEYAKNVNF